jgi:hypothetical protein
VNQVGVPVANSEEISEAAAAGFVAASDCNELGRTPKRAKLADALAVMSELRDRTSEIFNLRIDCSFSM